MVGAKILRCTAAASAQLHLIHSWRQGVSDARRDLRLSLKQRCFPNLVNPAPQYRSLRCLRELYCNTGAAAGHANRTGNDIVGAQHLTNTHQVVRLSATEASRGVRRNYCWLAQ